MGQLKEKKYTLQGESNHCERESTVDTTDLFSDPVLPSSECPTDRIMSQVESDFLCSY